MLNKDNLFRPSKAESKAESTTKIAREIIGAEVAERDAKTARLRAARAERDASEAAQKPAPGPKKRASAKSKTPSKSKSAT